MFTERSYLYTYIDARAIHSTSVGLAQARPNNIILHIGTCDVDVSGGSVPVKNNRSQN